MPHSPARRRVLQTIPLALAGLALGKVTAQTKVMMAVYKDPTCGCCHKWIEYMEANGFSAVVTNGEMGPVKTRFKIPANLESCHTTLIQGFIFEGHIPVEDVRRMLKEKPKGIVGLTIPGMPQSAPGMDARPFQPYDVLSFDSAGKTTIYAKHLKA